MSLRRVKTSCDDNSLPHWTWRVYPAGADVTVMDGAMRIFVTKKPLRGWQASMSHSVGGCIFIVDHARTKEHAIGGVEAWLYEQAKHAIQALGESL